MAEEKKKTSSRLEEQSKKLEEQIREQQRRKEERQFLEELAKRVSISKEGRLLFEQGKFSDAMGKYRKFLALTAKSFKVEMDNLHPGLFEEKSRAAESLLMSAILFDLSRILDKLDTPAAKEERRQYHRLYVRFTVKQPFQNFAAENLRKYIKYTHSIRHKNEFKGLYNAVKKKGFCVVATELLGECEELDSLRKFRNETLAQSTCGRALIEIYYYMGPTAVRGIRALPASKAMLRPVVRRIGDWIGR